MSDPKDAALDAAAKVAREAADSSQWWQADADGAIREATWRQACDYIAGEIERLRAEGDEHKR